MSRKTDPGPVGATASTPIFAPPFFMQNGAGFNMVEPPGRRNRVWLTVNMEVSAEAAHDIFKTLIDDQEKNKADYGSVT